MRRTILTLVGTAAILMGLLWVAQGLGWVNWPTESFMIADRQWAIRGAVLAAVGAITLLVVRRS
ncbi:hypothetical protein [Sphingomonas sp. LT1P40]|uniref:hypothetical protein n=1 Tax=Alteristakelama amylovorans TaxID=3096166 RepID=UPI002FC69356